MSITLGADPEWFVYKKKPRGMGGIIPCVGLIPGSKLKPTDMGDGYAVHEDNVSVELTVPVSTSPREFSEVIEKGKVMLQEMHLTPLEITRHLAASHRFTLDQLASKQAQEFGCEPDFNAYNNGEMRTTPQEVLESQWRHAGGHVHIGGDFNCPPFVVALFADLFIGVPERWPSEGMPWPIQHTAIDMRGAWYGQPGTFRPKPYGIEYRSPTNIWTSNPNTAHSMGDRCWRLAHWLETTSATKIREALKNVDWIRVRAFLNNYTKDRDLIRDECSQIMDDVQQWCPL